MTYGTRATVKRDLALIQRNLDGRRHIADVVEEECLKRARSAVAGLERIAMDQTVSADIRRLCFNDILDRAVGKPMIKASFGHQDGGAVVADNTIEAEIIAARVSTAMQLESDQYLGRVPYDDWPEHIKRAHGFGDQVRDAEVVEESSSESPEGVEAPIVAVEDKLSAPCRAPAYPGLPPMPGKARAQP